MFGRVVANKGFQNRDVGGSGLPNRTASPRAALGGKEISVVLGPIRDFLWRLCGGSHAQAGLGAVLLQTLASGAAPSNASTGGARLTRSTLSSRHLPGTQALKIPILMAPSPDFNAKDSAH